MFLIRKFEVFVTRSFLSLMLAFGLLWGSNFLYSTVSEIIHLESHKFSLEFSTVEASSKDQNDVLGASTDTIYFQPVGYSYKARVLDLYFKENNSPLYGQGQNLINACNKYGAPEDCTLLPAIARVETNLCKTDISAKQFNCWGYGGSGPNRIIYSSFQEAIDNITMRLVRGYGANFFNDPEIGELTYCGPHCNRWGDHVKAEQGRIKQFATLLGYSL